MLLDASAAFENFIAYKDPAGTTIPHLKNISYITGRARQHLIVLMAARHLSADLFLDLCKQLEEVVFVFVLTRTPKNVLERQFALWATTLRGINSEVEYLVCSVL
jgi:hypothetical protein